ncbi:MAG: hypothetical protein ABSC41_00605 [Acidimicrobiales bacterium]|jgi:hypothetical protein
MSGQSTDGDDRSSAAAATSIDGRSFSFVASLHDLTLRVGGYVTVGDGLPSVLGQILTLELGRLDATGASAPDPHGIRSSGASAAVGTGSLLADARPFDSLPVRPATPPEMAGWLDESRPAHAALNIGELAGATSTRSRTEKSMRHSRNSSIVTSEVVR